MDDWNVLDDDEIVAATKALRRLLDGSRPGSAEFTLHHSSFLLAIDGDDDHLACRTHLQDDSHGLASKVHSGEHVLSLFGRTIDLPLDDVARKYDMLDILGEDVVLAHFFECMHCKNLLPLPNKRMESSQLSFEHPEAILHRAILGLKGGTTCAA